MIRALAGRVDEVVVLADRALPGVLPENCRVRPFAARSRPGRGVRFETALAAELAHRPKPAAVDRAHVPDLRGAGGAARPAARREGAPLVHALACLADAAGGRARLEHGAQRRPADVPARIAEGARDRPRDRPLGVLVLGRRAARRPARGRARPLLAGEGARRRPPRPAARARRRPRRPARAVRAGLESRRARVPRRARAAGRGARSRKASEARPRRASRRGSGALRPRRRARQQHARRRDRQGRLRGVRGVRAGARVEPGVRHACCRRSSASSARIPARWPTGSLALGAREDRRELGRMLRERVAESHSVDHWAAAVVEAAT